MWQLVCATHTTLQPQTQAPFVVWREEQLCVLPIHLLYPMPKNKKGKAFEVSYNVNLEQLVAGDQNIVGGGGCECRYPEIFSFPCEVRACVCACVRACVHACVRACVRACVPLSPCGIPTLCN